MKPVIIKVDKDDNVTMTLSEFQKCMDDAYEQGKKDGESVYWWRYANQIPSIPTVITTCTGTEGTTITAKNVCTAGSTTATFTPNTTTE